MAVRTAPVAPRSFYMTLPSNASLDSYPNNKPGNYTVKLNPALDLHGAYECALTEISLPRTWANLPAEGLYATLTNRFTKKSQRIQLPPGHYGTMSYLVSQLNTLIKVEFKPNQPHNNRPSLIPEDLPSHFQKNVFCYQKNLQKLFLTLPLDVQLILSPQLAQLLGFNHNKFIGPTYLFADHTPDLNIQIGALYVYLSIIENRIVGDTRAPLLRIIPIHSTKGDETLFYSFINLQFIPVRITSFDHVTVNIRDGQGNLVSFEKGAVIATLQFQRRLPF